MAVTILLSVVPFAGLAWLAFAAVRVARDRGLPHVSPAWLRDYYRSLWRDAR